MKELLEIGDTAHEYEYLAENGSKENKKEGTLLGLQVVCPHLMTILAALTQHGTRSFFIGSGKISSRINSGGLIMVYS